MKVVVAVIIGALFMSGPPKQTPKIPSAPEKASLSTVAMRVKHMEKMVAFYTEAFAMSFYDKDTFGIKSKFGQVGEITIKLVPIRDQADFEGFPVHQLGLTVSNVDKVIAVALKHGGRQEGQVLREGGKVHAAIRDPDGNTIELYEQK